MADFRLPVHQISATVNGRTYRSDGRGMFVVTDASDIAEFQKIGAIREGGVESVPEWADSTGNSLVGPAGGVVELATWSDSTGTALVGPDGTSAFVSGRVLNPNNLHWSAKKLAAIHNGDNVRWTTVQIGDSVAGQNHDTLNAFANRELGLAGIAGREIFGFEETSGTVTRSLVAHDLIMTGAADIYSNGAVRRYNQNGGYIWGTYFAVYVVKRPGDGTVTVELIDETGTLAETIATAASCNGALTDALLVLSTTLGAVGRRKIQVTATGTCAVVATAAIDRSNPGHVWVEHARGGLTLTASEITDNGLAHSAQFAANVEADFLHVVFRENVGAIAEHMPRIIAAFDAELDEADWMFIGPTAGSVDAGLSAIAAPSYQMGQELYRLARDRGAVFVDAFSLLGSNEDLLARDANFDGVHVNTAEQEHIAMVVATETPLYRWVSNNVLRGDTHARNAFVVVKEDSRASTVAAGSVTTDTVGADLKITGQRWIDLTDATGTSVQLRSVNIDGSRGVINGAGVSLSAGYYPEDGAFSIFVHPTTGVVTLEAKVGGVLKTLALGTAT